MVDGYTIEEIQGQFLLYTDLVEGVAEHLAELWSRLAVDAGKLDPQVRRELEARARRYPPRRRSPGRAARRA